MGKFAKLIDLENDEQVLLTIDWNDDDEKYELNMQTEFEGCTASIKLGFEEAEDAMGAMENYKEKNAIAFRADMAKMFE